MGLGVGKAGGQVGVYWAGQREPGEFSLGEHPDQGDEEYWDHEPKLVGSCTEEDLTKSSETIFGNKSHNDLI